MKIYAKVGDEAQQIDLSANPVKPNGYTEMQQERPDNGVYTAKADGTWLFVETYDVRDARNEKARLESIAEQKITFYHAMNTQNIVDDNYQQALADWMNYYTEISAIDITQAPDINWPVIP